MRPDSPAFDDDSPTEPMSVVVVRARRDPNEFLAGHEGFGLVSLTIEDLASCGQRLVADALADEPDHALVVGAKTQSTRRQLSKMAVWVIPPPA